MTAQSESLQDIVRQGVDVSLLVRSTGLLGLVTILFLAWLMSSHKRRVSWRLVVFGVGLQAAVGFVVLKTAAGQAFFRGANAAVTGLLGFQEEGSRALFGNLVDYAIPVDGSVNGIVQIGAVLAFSVLPTIVFFSSLMSVLYYLNIMPRIVKMIAWVMQKTLRTSGAETLSAAGNIFVGQTEAPLLIRPYVGRMTMSELNTVMVGGFATVAGGVLAAYVGMLSGYFPDIAGHLLTASVMNAPAGIVIAKILLPEMEEPVSTAGLHVEPKKLEYGVGGAKAEERDAEQIDAGMTHVNLIDAAASGAATGAKLAINVGAMLMAFIALVATANFFVGWLGGLVGWENLTLQSILGLMLRPLAWLMGVPWQDAGQVGALMGVKTVVNELVAYSQLAGDLQAGTTMSPRAILIATYALLGFANFSSIAIQIGGIGGLAPERRADLSRLGLRAMIGGNLAAFMSATWVGIML